jgi:hypothetical protein
MSAHPRSAVVPPSPRAHPRHGLCCALAAALAFTTSSALRAADVPPATSGPPLTEAGRFFLDKVRPVLTVRCVSCHGRDKAEGGLRLDSREAALSGGDSGPALVPGKPAESLLLMAVKRTHKVIEMPPKDKLAARDIAILERWVQDGAPWPEAQPLDVPVPDSPGAPIGDAWTDPRNPIAQLFAGARLDLWSLRPIVCPEVPKLPQSDWAVRELDFFILQQCANDGVAPVAAADPRTLARRLHFDLSGLPPAPQQVADFETAVAEHGLDVAVANLVDELLASPHFGEHFARLWLDVVRYSDSNGFDWDEFRPHAWRFRDYVVRSLNADKAYDQFIREQLAGDELFDGPPSTAAERDSLIATSYLRLGPHDSAAPLFAEQDRSRAELLADVTETTATAFLGLTFNCCRCHDHKHDPLSQADHYRLRAFFEAVQFADNLSLDSADEQESIKAHNAPLEAEVRPLREKLKSLPAGDKTARDELQNQIKSIEQKMRPLQLGLLMTDSAEKVPATHVLFQGDHKQPRGAVEPGFLSVLDPQPAKIVASHNPATTGRRLTLAMWITSPRNPLTARVFVNRVWQSLMGRAIVPTPNDFGLAGAPPHDPALLDWLASEFVRDGWSVKRLVRQIATSATYRQAANYDNSHFALRSPRRLSAEQLRDALLFTSGLLTAKVDGPPVWPDLPSEILKANPAFLDENEQKTKGWYPSPKGEQYCRSLFLVQKRNTRIPLLETFDQPDNSTPCACRQVSTVAPQALTLLNSALVIECANALAKRVEREAGGDPSRRVAQAFQLALQRPPDEAERNTCELFLSRSSLPELCRALLNVNEFAYVD